LSGTGQNFKQKKDWEIEKGIPNISSSPNFQLLCPAYQSNNRKIEKRGNKFLPQRSGRKLEQLPLVAPAVSGDIWFHSSFCPITLPSSFCPITLIPVYTCQGTKYGLISSSPNFQLLCPAYQSNNRKIEKRGNKSLPQRSGRKLEQLPLVAPAVSGDIWFIQVFAPSPFLQVFALSVVCPNFMFPGQNRYRTAVLPKLKMLTLYFKITHSGRKVRLPACLLKKAKAHIAGCQRGVKKLAYIATCCVFMD
jgi:hypothetical protein